MGEEAVITHKGAREWSVAGRPRISHKCTNEAVLNSCIRAPFVDG